MTLGGDRLAIARAFTSGLPGCNDETVDRDIMLPTTAAMPWRASARCGVAPYCENISR